MRKYLKNGGSKYYTQNIQVNNFTADSLFSAPINILHEQLAKLNETIKSRYYVSFRAKDIADKIDCRISSFRMQISRDGWIVDKYILKFVTQLELKQVELMQWRMQEDINAWRDVSGIVLKKLDVERQLAEEKSKLELIADSGGGRRALPRKSGTPRFPDGL